MNSKNRVKRGLEAELLAKAATTGVDHECMIVRAMV